MKQLKNALVIALLTFLTILVAACSQPATGGITASNSTTSSNTTSNSAASTSTASSYDNSGYYGGTSTPGSSSALKVATTTIKGVSTTILTDAQGKTLYYFTPDSPSASKCLSSCTPTWPPLLAASSTPTLPANSAFTGTLSALDGGNGKQLQYNGHFLYTFSGDNAPGDANGQGIGGKWFVVTPNLK
jgi:predicted lipoprotein with Yx(FWY)xxD motif